MGARGTNNFGKAITDVEIEQFLDSRDDFELELFAVRTLKGNGWEVRHGGRYIDPVKGIGRQYDVRTWREFELGRRVSLAVECKSLSPEFPLVISRVPRPPTDVGHDVIVRRFNDKTQRAELTIRRPLGNHAYIYYPGEPVGKSATQIRWEANGKKLTASDADTYEKWSQAVASAAQLVKQACTSQTQGPQLPVFTFVAPVLLVNEGTLWVVDYDQDGQRRKPAAATEAQLFLGQEHVVHVGEDGFSYRLNHLLIFTRNGFTAWLQNCANPTGLVLFRIFESVVLQELR
jgi:hypothetical protein